MSKTPMMACGHAANATSRGEPCCVICHGDPKSQQIVNEPNLVDRLAKCSYGDTIVKSSVNLAFFKYKGPDSNPSKNMCKHCDYALKAHWSQWKYKLAMKRDWFAHKNMQDNETRTEHMPDKDAMIQYLEAKMIYMKKDSDRPWMFGEHKGQVVTKIHEIAIEYVKGPLPSGRGHDFEPHGSFEYDEYYCGCHGWD